MAAGVGERAALSCEERELLLDVARRTLTAHLARAEQRLPEPQGALEEKRGAFVSLHRRSDGSLRGCVGAMRSDESLLATVARMAVAAATQDGRFEPVVVDELPDLTIEISALGPLRPVRPADVEVGRDGLLISEGGRRGVLLPQVPVEHGWDREEFLAHTCWKAHLPEDAWRRPGAELFAFTAEVFGEE
jgi:AmmeMemoRadiSam system protein A